MLTYFAVLISFFFRGVGEGALKDQTVAWCDMRTTSIKFDKDAVTGDKICTSLLHLSRLRGYGVEAYCFPQAVV